MPTSLYLTSPYIRGPEALRVQKKLTALGYAPGPLDGIYGVTTESAVRAFQRDNGLEADGVVGSETRKALTAQRTGSLVADVVEAGPNRRTASSCGQRALAEALRHIGKRESPKGSNRTEFGSWYGVDGVPWCNIFVSYCFSIGADTVLCAGFAGAGCGPKGCAYVPTTEAWLRATGQWKGITQPLPGDIAIFNWDGGVPDHIGIVERSLGNGQFSTVEGNTAVGDDSNGGQVMRRLRELRSVSGFGRVVA